MTGVTPGVTCHQEVQHMRDGGGGEPHGPVWVPVFLTLQAGFFDLEAGVYTNKKSNPVGTCQKMTIQAG